MKKNKTEPLYFSEKIISGIRILVIVSSNGIKKVLINPAEEMIETANCTKLRNDDPYLFGVFEQLSEYLSGLRKSFNVPFDIEGTDFQKKVWNELKNIPYGKTLSYKELSERIGNIKSIRAVGKANSQNPLAILIPCHRVIGTSGSLTGYATGLAIKEKLLLLEGVINPKLFD